MANRTSLREFQHSFAERMRDLSAQKKVASKLGFEVGHENYLVTLSEVSEVIPVPSIMPVPQTQLWFKGLANVRGKLYSLVDFAAFLGGEAASVGVDRRVLLLHDKIIEGAGLVVGKMLGLRNPESFSPEPQTDTNTATPWVKQRYRDTNGVRWNELDLAALARHPAFLQAGISQQQARHISQ